MCPGNGLPGLIARTASAKEQLYHMVLPHITKKEASVKISSMHWKCIENIRAMISIRTAKCILTYGGGVWGGACPSPVKKTLNKWASVNISGTNWKSIGHSSAMHFQCIPLNFMCPKKDHYINRAHAQSISTCDVLLTMCILSVMPPIDLAPFSIYIPHK